MSPLSHSLANKVAIVTGASRGIGRAIAESLAAAGASVVVNHRDSAAQAAETVAAIERAGGRAAAIQADMANLADIQRLVSTTIEKFGALDILVNNAGVGNRTAMADMTAKRIRLDDGRQRPRPDVRHPGRRPAHARQRPHHQHLQLRHARRPNRPACSPSTRCPKARSNSSPAAI